MSAKVGASAAISVAIVISGCVVGNSGNWLVALLILAPGIIVVKPFAGMMLQVSQLTRQFIVETISAVVYAPAVYFLLGLVSERFRRS